MSLDHSIQILNLANTFSKASLKLIKVAEKESGNEKALSCIPAIFCAKHASELYIKSILEKFGSNEFGHNQSELIKKCFLLLRKKYYVKKYKSRLNKLEKTILAYHKNIIAGVKIIKGEDTRSICFRYIGEDTSWSKKLHQIDLILFAEEVKNLSKDAKFLHMLAQLN